MRSLNSLKDINANYMDIFNKAIDTHAGDYEIESKDNSIISYTFTLSKAYGAIKLYFNSIYDEGTDAYYYTSPIGWDWR